MIYVSRKDVILELEKSKYKNNLTARRWLRDDWKIDQLVEIHNSWNRDHTAEEIFDMVYPLDFHMECLLDQPRHTEATMHVEND